MNYAVILAGGKGERFWPLSRMGHPKQLLEITSNKTMLQETIDRVGDFIPIDKTLIVTGANLKGIILEKVTILKEKNLIIEPEAKSTCLAIGVAAVHIKKINSSATMIVLSSDHFIQMKEKLQKVLRIGSEVANQGDYLVTLGIIPTRAETSYGYIELTDLFNTIEDVPVYRINRFKEKPSRIVAQEYYYDRKHLWNSGIFIWRVDVILKALEKYMPELFRELDLYFREIGTKNQEQALKNLYAKAENISIDCAVLEKAENVLTIKADLVWDDIGSWLALERIKERDRLNNVIIGKAQTLATYETTIVNDGPGIITTLGVSDLVIVRTGDIVFVAHKTKAQDIKELLEKFASDENLEKYL
ncbi:MAG: sugar phosphate nucleotidyltransferase [candidate division Zixibacteria bacterium]|nr:sugar phosphate nucleotidyltransferase [candidate division Zixibacteria bacterium]